MQELDKIKRFQKCLLECDRFNRKQNKDIEEFNDTIKIVEYTDTHMYLNS